MIVNVFDSMYGRKLQMVVYSILFSFILITFDQYLYDDQGLSGSHEQRCNCKPSQSGGPRWRWAGRRAPGRRLAVCVWLRVEGGALARAAAHRTGSELAVLCAVRGRSPSLALVRVRVLLYVPSCACIVTRPCLAVLSS